MTSFFRELDRRSMQIVSNETGKSIDTIKKIYAKGKILTSEDAKSFGIVQEIKDMLYA